jgi:hypothetical protein
MRVYISKKESQLKKNKIQNCEKESQNNQNQFFIVSFVYLHDNLLNIKQSY